MSYEGVEESQAGAAPVELFKFTIGTSKAYWLTSADQAQVFLGDTYTPEPIVRGEMAHSGEREQGSVEIEVPISSSVAANFIPYTPEPAMGLTIYRKHRSDPGYVVSFIGTVASASFDGARATLRCLPILEALRRRIPRNSFSHQCTLALYSARCGVVKTAFRVPASVATIVGDTITGTGFSTKPDGWFNNGWVERATGERRMVVTHVGTTITLVSPFVGLVVGETVDGYAGCERTEADCHTKFGNILNHLGWARVPTKNPFSVGLT